jgi:hypothetical protein
MWNVTFARALCGALVFACIAVSAACQKSNATNATQATTSTKAAATASATPTPSATADEGDFEGRSEVGDIKEALKNATTAAHQGLNATKVQWRLLELSGIDGGFTPPRNEITVKIHARKGVPG